jgi:hypothetical protein
MSGKLVIISTDETVREVEVTSKMPSLEMLQRHVGGYIERVKVRWEGRIRDAYVDEDGISKGLESNQLAHQMRFDRVLGPAALFHQETSMLFGPCVIWVPDPCIGNRRPKAAGGRT